jgi:hypothetical protein
LYRSKRLVVTNQILPLGDYGGFDSALFRNGDAKSHFPGECHIDVAPTSITA